jgi:hypothetical protein
MLITADKYFDHPALNVSSLKQLYNPKWIKYQRDNPDAETGDKRHFRIGGALDAILTQPEVFLRDYAVAPAKKPGGMMGVFIDALPLDLDKDSPEDEYLEAYAKSGYKTPISKIIEKLWSNPEQIEYYNALKRAKGKTIISYDEYEEVNHAKEYLLNNPYTRPYFQDPRSHIIIKTQVGIVFKHSEDDVQCKALLDGIIIDTENKTIQPYDLKTIGVSITSFPFSFLKYGYYLQAAHYYNAVKYMLENHSEDLRLAWDLPESPKDYELKFMEFVVSEKKLTQSNPARIFCTTENDYKLGLNGGKVGRRYYPGINELISQWKWHEENNNWDYPKELIENNGKFILDIQNQESNG